LRTERSEATGGQPIATGDVEDVLPRLEVQERGEGGPAQDVQDVNKKPYTFLLIFSHNIAFTR